MSTQFLLDEDDIKELTKLMLIMIETQESRKQLCKDLGIDPQKISFIKDNSDDTFCTELIDCLNRYGYQKGLCKLCCQKLFPILNKSVYSYRRTTLQKIVEKLNCDCNHESSNIYSNTKNLTEVSTNDSIFGENIRIIAAFTGVVVFFGGGLMYYFTSHQSQQIPTGTYQISCRNISVKNSILTGACEDFNHQWKTTSLDYERCIYGIENIDGRLECKSL
jgi:hypothetical protein